jgi:hypothetical protein
VSHSAYAVFGAATAAEIVLPSVVGIALAVVYPATVLAVDALSYAASAAFILTIHTAMYNRSRARQPLSIRLLVADIMEGLRYLAAHVGVRTMTLVGSLQSAAGAGFVALMVVWCDRVLGIGTAGLRFGLVFSSWSVGGLVATVALPRRCELPRRRASPCGRCPCRP